MAAEELTVSLKMRRDVIVDHHHDELDQLYQGEPGRKRRKRPEEEPVLSTEY